MQREVQAELFQLRCIKCGATYPADFLEGWGTAQYPETHGYGPTPKCVKILTGARGSGAWCGGMLVHVAREGAPA